MKKVELNLAVTTFSKLKATHEHIDKEKSEESSTDFSQLSDEQAQKLAERRQSLEVKHKLIQ